jgi:predicted deacylase
MNNQKKFPLIPSKWHAPTDPKQVLPRLLATCGRRKFITRVLGTLPSGDDILLFQKPAPPGSPSVLILAGCHGEEPGGPLGILRLLETAPDTWLEGTTLSLIPILNPTGHRVGQRHNQWGENPNDGFCHPDLDPTPPSKEGRILLANLSLLKQCSKDAFLSLHEDGLPTGHIYAYGMRPTGAANALLAEMAPFGVTESMRLEDGAMLCDGMSLNHHDGSFEDRLFHEGSTVSICTETPRIASLDLRAEVNDRIVRALLTHVRSRTIVRL